MQWKPLNGTSVIVMKVCFSGAIWLMSGVINVLTKPLTGVAPGTDIIYLPAGLRLVIVIVAGVWGALGVAITNPVFFYLQLGLRHPIEALVNTLIGAFLPLLIVAGARKISRIDDVLKGFNWLQLLMLMAAVSVALPLFFSIAYVAFNYYDRAGLWPNMLSMMLGDFSGCLVVIVLVKAAIKIDSMIAPWST